jgi:hypothetical protein
VTAGWEYTGPRSRFKIEPRWNAVAGATMVYAVIDTHDPRRTAAVFPSKGKAEGFAAEMRRLVRAGHGVNLAAGVSTNKEER